MIDLLLNSPLFRITLLVILMILGFIFIKRVLVLFIDIFKIKTTKSKSRQPKAKKRKGLVSKKVLTKDEIRMLEVLEKALPKYNVLVQVSMNAFMTTQDIGLRNEFNRLYVDFLVVDCDFNPLLSIELDSHYHKYIKDKDKRRDEIVNAAGITVVRFNEVPDVRSIRSTLSDFL